MKKALVFSQDIHPYRHEILVCVGATPKDILKWVKVNGTKYAQKDFSSILSQEKELFEKIVNGEKKGYALHFTKDKRDYYFLLLQTLSDKWDYWECLIHEISHIIDWIVEACMLEKETEARAYLHEWLFREIRRKIQGLN